MKGIQPFQVARGCVAAQLLQWLLVTLSAVQGQFNSTSTFNYDELCAIQDFRPGACEWTGDCPVEGCENRCQAYGASVGYLRLPLQDRAYDLDWWQLCPDLAQMVLQFDDDIFYDPEFQEEPVFYDLPCPTSQQVAQVSDTLVTFALRIQEGIDVTESGQPITADLQDWAAWGEEPNRARLLVEFATEPMRISQYLQANCTTVNLGGEDLLGRREHIHYGFFNRDTRYDHLSYNDTFDMCQDTFGGYDEYAKKSQQVDDVCRRPFGEADNVTTACWPPVIGVSTWPTTLPCAQGIADLHKVGNNQTLQVLNIVQEAQAECSSKLTEEECLMVPGEGYRDRVDAIVDQIPVKSAGGKTPAELRASGTTKADTTTTDAPAVTSTNTSAPAPESGTGSSGAGSSGSGAEGSVGANPVEEVTVEDLERSAALRIAYCSMPLSLIFSASVVLGSYVMLLC